ncbi:MAG TPA: LuxR family transcriptional regulator, partial [Promineifilum sp.]|nr:LuxR family transcriptional regulator [Promineifilum sp.]
MIATKLYLPPSRPGIVQRPRLIDQLNRHLHRKLTLISAPAGFGKTTLVSEWVAVCGRPVAWLSLDEAESDIVRFLTYLIAALQTIAGHIGTMALPVLETGQPLPVEAILTSLVNDIAAVPNNFILILDDYHLVDNPAVDRALGFLLEHWPPQMHLAITTREDPNLPLARLRMRDQLTELRAAD